VPWVRRTKRGLRAVGGPDAVELITPVKLHGKDLTTVAEFDVAEGDEVPFTLIWYPSNEEAPKAIDPAKGIAATEKWWSKWSSRCQSHGKYHDIVRRSLITLKALTFAPTGGIVAAPTTSLPEYPGGVRNWDYRICWVRDATFTLYSLAMAGYLDEAKAWREWMLRAVAGKPSQMNIMYGLRGERRLTELELDWLPGYENSRPVRIGNAAHKQFQLDVFGEFMDCMYAAERHGLPCDENAWRVQAALMEYLEDAWKQPDEGIWEVRGPRRHFTHSKVMAWVAADRMVKMVELTKSTDAPVDRWKKLRETIHHEVCERGYDPKRNTFTQYYGSKELDASLLMVPLVGFLKPEDKRVRGTVAAIERELLDDGFVQRYPTNPDVDGLPPGEGAFLPCSFWLADNLHAQGRDDEARELFERLVGLCNDVGLISEEYDAKAKRLLGNFPQAFTHVALVNTAGNLSRAVGAAAHRRER
jgi:GH15 family glucan-1,4-alpha-glucosidase